MKKLLVLCAVLALSCASFAQTHRIPAADTVNEWTNDNTFSHASIGGAFLPSCLNQGEAWTWVATGTGFGWQCQINAGQAGANGTNGTNGLDGAPGAPGYSPNQILTGCGVVWTSGLTFTISPCTYLIQNVQYSTALATETLTTADATNDRIDLIAVDGTGTVIKIDGTPAVNPIPPSVDVSSQLQLTFVYVPAGATIPANVVTTDIYHENTEWTCAVSAHLACASTSNPHAGTKDIEATAAVTGNFARLTIPSASIDLASRNNLVFWIQSKAAWASTRSLTLQWFNGNTAKCTPVTLKDGNFTFTSSNITAYQQIVIPTSVFSCSGIAVTRLQFTVAGTGTAIGFYVDDVILQGGVAPAVASAGLVGRGVWQTGTAYSVNDVVRDGGGSWYALQANSSSEPSLTNTNWFSMGAVAPFITQSPSPALSGVLRLSNSDHITFRNSTDTADCSLYLDSNNAWVFEPCGNAATEIDFVTEASASATTAASGHGTLFVDTSTGFPCAKDSSGVAHCATGGTGSVTSVATTSPIGGGTFTTTGTITCTTCVVASSPGAGIAHFAGSTQTVTSSTIATADIAANAVTSAKEAVVNTRRTCMLQVGDGTNSVVSGDYSPFLTSACYIPYAATVVEVNLQSDAGTPSVVLERRRGSATLADLLSGALAAAGTTKTCAMASTGQTCIDGTTSSGSITLSNTSLSAGDYIEVKSGTASTEKSMRIAVVFTVN